MRIKAAKEAVTLRALYPFSSWLVLGLFGEVSDVVPLASFLTLGKVATEAFESTATERARGSRVPQRRQCNGGHAGRSRQSSIVQAKLEGK